MAEYLGDALFALRGTAAPLRATMLEAERMTASSMRKMDAGIGASMASMSRRMGQVGSNMTRLFTVPILGIAGATAKMAADFDRSMELIHTQAGASQRQVDKLKVSVLQLAKSVPYGPQPLADALYHLESIGLRNTKAMDALKIAAQGAAVGHANLEQTATALGSAWLVNIKGTGKLQSNLVGTMKGAANLKDVMAILNATVGVGNMRMQDLVTSLGTGILPMAKRAGLSIQDVMGALAVFSDEGYKAYSAATQMATALHYLYDPTAKATKALSGIGLGAGTLAADLHKPQGLLVALRDLQSHLDATFPGGSGRKLSTAEQTAAVDKFRSSLEASGMSAKSVGTQVKEYANKLKSLGSAAVAQEAVLGDVFPAGRGRVLSVLMNQLTRYDQKLGQINKGQKQYGDDIQKTMEQPAVKVQQAWARLESGLVSFGQHTLPPLLDAGTKIVGVADKALAAFSKLPPGLQRSIITGGLILAATGPALRILGFFTGGLTKLAAIAATAGRLAAGKGWRVATGRAGPGISGGAVQEVAQMRVAELVVANMTGGIPGGTRGGGSPVSPVAGGRGTKVPLENVPTVYDPASGRYIPYSPSGPLPPVKGKIREPIPTGRYMSHAQVRSIRAGAFPMSEPLFTQMYPHGRFGAPVSQLGEELKTAASGFGSSLKVAGGLALRGLGVLAIASFVAPVALGLGKAIMAWADHDARAAGRTFAKNFTKDLPAAVSNATKERLATATTAADSAKGLAAMHHLHAVRGGGALPGTEAPSAADLRSIFQTDFKQGYRSGQAFISGFQGVKFPSTPTLVRDMISHLKKLDPQARQQAAKMMLGFAASLEQHGQLPRGAVNNMIKRLHGAFPGLLTFLGRMGLASDKEFAKWLKFKSATNTLKNTLDDYRSRFGGFGQDVKLTGDNVNKYAKIAMDDLKWQMSHGSRDARKAATAEFEKLRAAVSDNLSKMGDQVDATVARMTHSIRTGTGQARQAAADNFQKYQDAVLTAMKNGTITTAKGSEMITKALNATLNAFGAKQIPFPSGLKALANPNFTLPGAVAGPGQSKAGHHAARGAAFQLGSSSDRGSDYIPLNVNGMRVLAGAGEKVAIFTADQQKLVDYRLADLGGLDGMFSRVNRRHDATPRYAHGGIVTASTFGGPGDPGTGSTGYKGDNLYQHPDSFAELNMGTALGGLPYMTPLTFTYNGKTGKAFKRDIGAGGAGLGGHTRAADLWFQFAQALGVSGLADVMVNSGKGVNIKIGGIGAAMGDIAAPQVIGDGTVSNETRAALKKMAKAANEHIQKVTPTVNFGVTGIPSGHIAGGGAGAYSAVMPVSRTDQGLDFTGAGPIGAILDAMILRTDAWPGWPGTGRGVVYSTAKGNVYAVENVIPNVHVGEHVKAGQQIATVLPGYPYLETGWANAAGTGPLTPYNGAADGTPMPGGIAFKQFLGLGRGGWANAARGFTTNVKKPHAQHAKRSAGHALSGRALGELAAAGRRVSALETDIADYTSRYNSLSSRFSTDEAASMYLNPDGSLNALGIKKKTDDDTQLLHIEQRLLSDYMGEYGPVVNNLRKFLRQRGKIDKRVAMDEKTLAKHKIEEGALRAAQVALSKPTKDRVGAFNAAIKKVKDHYGPLIKAAQKARASYHGKNAHHRHALSDAVTALQGEEFNAVHPIEVAMHHAQGDQRHRRMKLSEERYKIRMKLRKLTNEDAKIRGRDTTLKGILTGSGGAQGDNATIAALETVADKLGTVEWGRHGKFLGIDTRNQGAVFDTQTAINQLKITIGQDEGLTTTPAVSDTSTAQIDLLQQLNAQLGRMYQISQAQYKTLASFPPYGGSFASGGIVPGPLGEPRTIVAHGGEEVSDGSARVVQVIVHDGAVDPNKIEVIAEGAAVKVVNATSRRVHPLPGSGGRFG